MSENIEIINNILPLLSTIEEGLQHVKQLLSELKYEEALGFLENTMIGIGSIDDAIKPMQPELEENKIEPLGTALKASMDVVVDTYEIEKEEELENQIDKVIETFANWKQEIERILTPYISA